MPYCHLLILTNNKKKNTKKWGGDIMQNKTDFNENAKKSIQVNSNRLP